MLQCDHVIEAVTKLAIMADRIHNVNISQDRCVCVCAHSGNSLNRQTVFGGVRCSLERHESFRLQQGHVCMFTAFNLIMLYSPVSVLP